MQHGAHGALKWSTHKVLQQPTDSQQNRDLAREGNQSVSSCRRVQLCVVWVGIGGKDGGRDGYVPPIYTPLD